VPFTILLSSLFSLPLSEKNSIGATKKSRNPPPPPSPDAPADRRLKDGELHDKFNVMLIDPLHVVDDDFPDDWGINDTEEVLAVSGVDDSRLKD
jgi:hypothetical protein